MTPSRIRTALPFVAAWAGVGIGVILLVTQDPLGAAELVFAAGSGAVLGLASAWFETAGLERHGRTLTPGAAVAVRTLFYATALPAAIALLAVSGWVARTWFGLDALAVYGVAQTVVYFQSGAFAAMVAAVTVASFAVNLARQVRLVVGPGTLWALFSGRYRLPVEEHRAFLFLDLTDSTAIAQRLGPTRFHAFKNEFFRDVAGPILATGGQVYQYVGDEVVVTWRVRGGGLPRSPVETFVLLDEAVARRADEYRARYGEAPRFKAGLHAGPVVTAEVGGLKKDVVHSGDAVNVAARIEGQCHAMGARLLVSEAALALAPLPSGVGSEDVGVVELRGRDGAVRLFRVEAAREATDPGAQTRLG